MTTGNNKAQGSLLAGLEIKDFIFAVLRHKWKILICTLVGLVTAASVYFSIPPTYESESRLLVRYVIERNAIDSVESQQDTGSARHNKNVINAELEILKSLDLAKEVVPGIGIERLLPGASDRATALSAAGVVRSGLSAQVIGRGSNVIRVSYQNRDPELAVTVLRELVKQYFDKHLEIHRSAGVFDFISQQADFMRSNLKNTEEELRKLKSEAGIFGIADSEDSMAQQINKNRENLLESQAELVVQRARVKALTKFVNVGEANTVKKSETEPSDEDVQQYAGLVQLLRELRGKRNSLLVDYTPEYYLVKLQDERITEAERKIRALQLMFPGIVNSAVTVSDGSGPNLMLENTKLAALEAKVGVLEKQVKLLEGQAKKFADANVKISALERKKKVEQERYLYSESTLEKARIDEALDPAKIPNISEIQKPTPAVRVSSDIKKKIVLGLAGSGFIIGIAFALLLELFLDRRIKRPEDMARMNIPYMLSIPYIEKNRKVRVLAEKKEEEGEGGQIIPFQKEGKLLASPWADEHFARPYADAIRDKLCFFFEVNKLANKPKLVGVTGASEGVGASTIAATLAASFSDMGDGKVLLVDMNIGNTTRVHPFFEGNAVCALTDALKAGDKARVRSTVVNHQLFFATVAPRYEGAKQFVPKAFYDLMPQFKVSDFDYIIFDMSPISSTSPTMAIASFMDKVIVVAEAEQTNRDSLKRCYEGLSETNTSVAAVLNKANSA